MNWQEIGSHSANPKQHQSLLGSEPVLGVHHEQTSHQVETLGGQLARVLLLDGLWFCNVWEFEPYEARILGELLLLKWSKCS